MDTETLVLFVIILAAAACCIIGICAASETTDRRLNTYRVVEHAENIAAWAWQQWPAESEEQA